MSRFWRQAWAVARRDLLVEGRAGEALSVVLPFAAVAVFVVPLATDATASLLERLAGPVYWLVALLFGMQVAIRQTVVESLAQRRMLALLGLDPAARFAGRSLASGGLLYVVLLALAPLVALFYDPELPPPLLFAGVLALLAAGLAMLGTLAGDITTGLRTRSTLAPLLVAPLAVPLLMGAAQALEPVSRAGGSIPWILVLVIADLALAVTGVLTARPLEEATT
ncbi:MAG: heme exporter protein CcmB [Acidimicrobiia bacterium]|jgi:heme exporter protein B